MRLYCFFIILCATIIADDELVDDDRQLALQDGAFKLPFNKTVYLTRDFIKQGHKAVKLKDMSDFMCFVWHNRYVKDLVYDRLHIAPVTEDFRRSMFCQVVDFRKKCHSDINLTTNLMLTNEVRKVFADDSFKYCNTWREGIKLLNAHTVRTQNKEVAYKCCYGEAFSGNWTINAQNQFMELNNIKWRDWDVPKRKCPNGFFSHMFTSTKGHHVKDVDEVNYKSFESAREVARKYGTKRLKYTISPGTIELTRDPFYIDVRKINDKVKEMGGKGKKSPTVADFQKLLASMYRTNVQLCRKLTAASLETNKNTSDEDYTCAVAAKTDDGYALPVQDMETIPNDDDSCNKEDNWHSSSSKDDGSFSHESSVECDLSMKKPAREPAMDQEHSSIANHVIPVSIPLIISIRFTYTIVQQL